MKSKTYDAKIFLDTLWNLHNDEHYELFLEDLGLSDDNYMSGLMTLYQIVFESDRHPDDRE